MIYSVIRMRKSSKTRNILIVLWLAGSAGRKQLTGILNYVKNGHPWSIHLITDPADFGEAALRAAGQEGIDGFIGHVGPAAAEALARTTIPTVLIDFPPPTLISRKESIAILLDPDEEIGRCGAEYFLKLGNYASFGFVPDAANRGWSRLRERGYKQRLQQDDIACQVFNPSAGALADWLAALPKPTAVMVAYDIRAKETLEACRKAHLDVPRQVALLGVDNDEIVCDYSTPSLSSVKIDHEAFGREAAKMLSALMTSRRKHGLQRVFMPVGSVVERESTAPVPPVTHIVRRIREYISAHATEKISVSDVVSHLGGISRRMADLRFHEATGGSIRRAIEDRRLELVKHRLLTTNLNIAKISRLCGYPNVQRLKYVFKSRIGMSMREYRTRQG